METAAMSMAAVSIETKGDKSKMPILNERNYHEWRRRLMALLYKKGVYSALEEETLSTDTAVKLTQQKAFGIILEHLPSGLMEKYLDDPQIVTPKQLLEAVDATKRGINEQLVHALTAQITSFAWHSAEPEIEYNRFLRLYQEYTGAGSQMAEEDAVC